MGNEIANHTVVVEGRAKAEELFAGKERATLEKHARDYISKSGTKSSIMAAYLEHRQSIDPDKRYQAAEGGFEQKEQGINKFYKDEKRKTSVDTARDKDKWFSQGDFESGVDKVKQGQNSISKKLEKGETSLMNRYKDINSEVSKDIEVGANKAESSAFSMGNSVRPVLVEDQVDRNKDSQSRNKEKIIERGKT